MNDQVSMGVFVPGLVLAITLVVQAFTTQTEFSRQSEVLDAQLAQQQPALQQARTLRDQLESIAGATAVLAEQGNANAILIRDQLRAQGIAINPPRSP